MIEIGGFDVQGSAERGADMDLRNPYTGEKLGVTFQVIGADAPTYRKNLRTIRDAIAKRPEAEPTDQDEAARLSDARLAAAALTGWSPNFTYGGQRPAFSLDEAIRIMTKDGWIADQVGAFRDRRLNFLKA